MYFLFNLNRTNTLFLFNIYSLYSFYKYFIFLFILNTKEVSSFRFHNNSYTFDKLYDFTLYGSKKNRSRFTEDEEETAIPQHVLDDLHTKCKSGLNVVETYIKSELNKIRDHRAVPSLIDHIQIETESGLKQLRYLASIVTSGNLVLLVHPYSKDNVEEIFTTLSTELKGYTVKLIENSISVTIPEFGPKVKKDAQDNVKRILNTGLDRIRAERQNTLKRLKALESGLSQDMLFNQKKQIESHIKSSTSIVEKMCNDKLNSLK